MQGLSKLNNKIKIIILVLYTFIAVLITFLVLNSATKTTLINGYSKQAGDDLLNVSFRIQEQRQSSNNNSNKHESSTYKIYAYLEKTKQDDNVKLAIDNIKIYVSGENKDSKLLFDEPNSSITKKIPETSKTTSFEANIIPNSIFVKKYDSSNELIDNEPKKLYFKITYNYVKKVSDSEGKETVSSEDRIIKYEVNLDKFTDDSSKLETRSFVEQSNKIINNGEPYDLQIKKSLSTTTESKERYNFIVSLNNPNLLNRKIKNIQINVYGKVLNDSKDTNNEFSEMIHLYTYCGSVISSTGSNVTTDVPTEYELPEMYIVSRIVYEDGKKENVEYKVIW